MKKLGVIVLLSLLIMACFLGFFMVADHGCDPDVDFGCIVEPTETPPHFPTLEPEILDGLQDGGQ